MTAASPLTVNRTILGDAARVLPTLPAASVDMILTSPPYFRLRDYQVPGQIGLEANIDSWVNDLDVVLRGLHRVLKPTGTLWLNLGDSYATHQTQGAARKSLLLAPERVASNLVSQGWVLRNKLIWTKANPMPTSVRDRLACTYEFVYVFAVSDRYCFNLDAIRVPHTTTPADPRRRSAASRAKETWRGPNSSSAAGLTDLHAKGIVGHQLGKNPGDVWRIASSNYRGSHHATFPVELARRAILAGCPPDGIVLDPFMGAGSTAVAAEELDRRWLGIELNPDFKAQADVRITAERVKRSRQREDRAA